MKPPPANGIGRILLPLFSLLAVATVVLGQRPETAPADSRPRDARARSERPPFDPPGPPGERGPGRIGGPGGVREDIKLVQQFDQDANKRLDAAERNAAREFLAKERAEGRSQTRGPRRPPRNDNNDPPKPGPRVALTDAKIFPDAPLYASNVFRTFFLEFENKDWEKELSDFHGTDVEVPA